MKDSLNARNGGKRWDGLQYADSGSAKISSAVYFVYPKISMTQKKEPPLVCPCCIESTNLPQMFLF